ncbi:hypothetical protein TSOC_009598 [Tetrabaena socialis]|uniref:Uncharacterized protein n=1 Tax=Tetrabaena socialis TaxID=47790 RepID=A0A2J7ZVE3_9CHLO|nr:hypothetical protein TSOC_009598 [Tetrabaena socialis]|eukprot:PNH04251.1 hypothetical protein TSOC_009598 [Tetrabaena socialis]
MKKPRREIRLVHVAQRQLPLLRFLLLVALAFGAVTAFWLAPAVNAGGSSGRQLQGILSGGHDETNDKLIELLKYAISAKQAPQPAPAPVPVPVVVPAQPAVAAAQPVLASPSDGVALTAAQALLGGNKGGINIVSTSPIALDNPIDISSGSYSSRGSMSKALGR